MDGMHVFGDAMLLLYEMIRQHWMLALFFILCAMTTGFVLLYCSIKTAEHPLLYVEGSWDDGRRFDPKVGWVYRVLQSHDDMTNNPLYVIAEMGEKGLRYRLCDDHGRIEPTSPTWSVKEFDARHEVGVNGWRSEQLLLQGLQSGHRALNMPLEQNPYFQGVEGVSIKDPETLGTLTDRTICLVTFTLGVGQTTSYLHVYDEKSRLFLRLSAERKRPYPQGVTTNLMTRFAAKANNSVKQEVLEGTDEITLHMSIYQLDTPDVFLKDCIYRIRMDESLSKGADWICTGRSKIGLNSTHHMMQCNRRGNPKVETPIFAKAGREQLKSAGTYYMGRKNTYVSRGEAYES